MTAVTSTRGREAGGAAGLGPLPGLRGLLGKELREWRRARRTWVVLVVSALFMSLTSLNSWLQANFAPAEGSAGVANPVVDPMANLLGAVSGQIFVVAAIFAAMSLIVTERESGTLAWTASKPVSRSAIWLAKLAAATAVLWIAAGLVPLAVTVAVVVALFGPVPASSVVVFAAGIGLAIALYVVIALAVATVAPSQAAVAGITLGALFLPQLLGLFVPPQVMPTSILQWALLAGVGEPAGLVTPTAWLVATVGLIAFSLWRMERLEL